MRGELCTLQQSLSRWNLTFETWPPFGGLSFMEENLLHASASEDCSPLHGVRRGPGIHTLMHFLVHADALYRLHHSRLFDTKKSTRCPTLGLALFN